MSGRDLGASVRQRLLNQACSQARLFQQLLQYFATERFLYRMVHVNPAAKVPAPILYVQAFGLNQYSAPTLNLRFAAPDARLAAETMAQLAPRLARYARVQTNVIADAAATKGNVIAALKELAGRITPSDGLVLYWAGHGFAMDGRFYLVPHDVGRFESKRELQNQEAIARLRQAALSDLELADLLSAIDAREMILVFDTCQSGGSLGDAVSNSAPVNAPGLGQLAYEKGLYILAASQVQQSALEFSKFEHGVLTYAVFEDGLKKGAADLDPPDRLVSIRELFEYAEARVPEIHAEQGRGSRLLELTSEATPVIQQPRVYYPAHNQYEELTIRVSGANTTR